MKKFMFDTNALDNAFLFLPWLEKGLEKGFTYHVTSIQLEETNEIGPDKKHLRISTTIALLELKFKIESILTIKERPLAQGPLRIMKSESRVFENIRNGKDSNIKDALIAESALHSGCVLVTKDKKLKSKMNLFDYPCMSFKEFMELVDYPYPENLE